MIRYALPQDLPRVQALWETGFGNEEPYTGWYFRRVWRSERTLLYENEGRPVSSLQLAPYRLSLAGRSVSAAYIVGVVTEPDCRGRGYASRLLRRALNDLERQGAELALLYTDIPGFYEPLGFTCCYHLRQLRFPAADEAGPLWPATQPAGKALDHCQSVYCRMCRDLDGYVLRTEDDWQTYVGDWLTDSRNGLYIGADAYFLTDRGETGLSLKELGYASQEALAAALAAAARLAAALGCDSFGWDAPEHAPLPRQARETRRPWVMARVTGADDLPADQAAAATRTRLRAPSPRLWVGEIT